MITIDTAALTELEARLQASGVDANPRNVASAILGIAAAKEWNRDPANVTRWIEQLALDVLRTQPKSDSHTKVNPAPGVSLRQTEPTSVRTDQVLLP
jgi:hypothetical protein